MGNRMAEARGLAFLFLAFYGDIGRRVTVVRRFRFHGCCHIGYSSLG